MANLSDLLMRLKFTSNTRDLPPFASVRSQFVELAPGSIDPIRPAATSLWLFPSFESAVASTLDNWPHQSDWPALERIRTAPLKPSQELELFMAWKYRR